MKPPLTLADIAEPRPRDGGLAFRLRRGLRKIWHALLPRKMTRVITRGGIRYAVNADEMIGHYILKHGFHEPDEIVFLFNAARERGAEVFLDIGANIGYYSLLAAKLGIFAEIHAFEPHPESYRRLLWHIRANNFEGVITPHNVAASDAAREMRMRKEGGAFAPALQVFDGDSPVAPDSLSNDARLLHLRQLGENVGVAAAPLDSLFSFRGRKICAKIDVEGHEAEALKGAANLLAHNNALLQIEIWPWKGVFIGEMISRGWTLIQYCNMDFYFVNDKGKNAKR